MVTNQISIKLVDKVIFSESFALNMGVFIAVSEGDTKLTVKPIKALDEFAADGAIVVAKLICQKLNSKGVYPCRNNGTLELTLQHRKFKMTSLNGSFLISVIDTEVLAVMTEEKA